MVSTPEHTGSARDPTRLLERAARESARIRERLGLERLELFHRGSNRVRVTRRFGRGEDELCFGRDDGVAVRLRGVGDAGVRFAAVSGDGGTAFDEAVSLALAGDGLAGPVSDRWAEQDEPEIDHDAFGLRPSPDPLRVWLDDAIRTFVESRAGGRISSVDQAWVEAAATVETWALDGRAVASRTRVRGWAFLRRAAGGSQPWQRPLLTAGVRWSEIDAGHWVRLDTQRTIPTAGSAGFDPGRGQTVVFTPETSAILISALFRTLTAAGTRSGSPVGRGLRVWDRPDAPDALFGGRFDDSGFPTRPKLLTDGSSVRERMIGPGHDRRPSFRDPPVPLPSQLSVEPPLAEPPPDAFHVSRLSIQPLAEDRWILETGGRIGSARVAQAFISTGPEQLIRGCTAGWGAAESSHRGVTTPSLVFEDLRVML